MHIEIVYALPDREERATLQMDPGSTVQDALDTWGFRERHPDIEIHRIGIWGRAATPQSPLRHLDRVEIYRPLKADPKEARRRRATKARK